MVVESRLPVGASLTIQDGGGMKEGGPHINAAVEFGVCESRFHGGVHFGWNWN